MPRRLRSRGNIAECLPEPVIFVLQGAELGGMALAIGALVELDALAAGLERRVSVMYAAD